MTWATLTQGFMCRQIEAMTASTSAQHAAHAEAERKLMQKLQSAEAAASQALEDEHAAKVMQCAST